MPVNSESTYKAWQRYAYCRDNGHLDFVKKAEQCERFFAGDQWSSEDKTKLAAVKRPALTINKIKPTVLNILGEQISNRAETSFRPRSGASSEVADILSKVFKQISDNNQLDWKRSDMFADGIIGSRGYLDVRLGYNDSQQGEVHITSVNAKNVIVDPDAEEYDPDTWSEVFTTKWLTADDIAVFWGKADADLLRNRDGAMFSYGYDSVETDRDRFGNKHAHQYDGGDYDFTNVQRNIRVIERQYRVLDRQQHFLSPETGDMRPVPVEFDRDRIAWFVEKYGFRVGPKIVRRIKWLAMADNVELQHDWSPYKHFTLVPYFPVFRKGNTLGSVESLLDPQELLNKVSSQELHVVNTTANSGYKVKAGALVNMTPAELEEKGAQTGIVIEVAGDPDKDVVKITPNSVPTGLDRISYKAEENIKSISGVSDSMQGFDREDVAAKAIQEKKRSGSTNLVKPMDSLARTDYILARNTLDIVQQFYTAERLMTITHDEATGETETFAVNQVNPMSREEFVASGAEGPYQEIVNDLTLGEFGVVVSSVPRRETLEDSQFEQAVSMREMGVALPDSVLVDSSRLIGKKDIIRQMGLDATTPEAQAAASRRARGEEAAVLLAEGEAASKHADAGLRGAKTDEVKVKTAVLANTPIETSGEDPAMKQAELAHQMSMDQQQQAHKEKMAEMEAARKRRETEDKLQLQAQDMAIKRDDARVAAVQAAAIAAQKLAPASKV